MVDRLTPQPESWSQQNFGQTFSLDVSLPRTVHQGLDEVLTAQLTHAGGSDST